MEKTIDKNKPDNQEENRNPDGTFKEGFSGNVNGRPKGKSLKEYWRQRFTDMTDEEKEEFSKKCSPELLYKMAEGNPANETHIKSNGKELQPILVKFIDGEDNKDTK
mgnify:CR=1 FL=1